jgi:hypothetical protein
VEYEDVQELQNSILSLLISKNGWPEIPLNV